MIKVSQAWKDNQKKTLVNESYVEISLDITDPDIREDSTIDDNGSIYISNTPQIIDGLDKSIIPYCTLEQNLWLLDSSRSLIPSIDRGDCGYIGNVLSDFNCLYHSSPLINIYFSKVHLNSVPAITITWSSVFNEYAVEFIVTTYNGDNIVNRKHVVDNNLVTSIVEMEIVDFDKITIQVLKWCLPNKRVRIEEIFIGMNKIYSKKELFSYEHNKTIDPLSASLPKDEILFTIDNLNNSYNPLNPNGLSKYLMERQDVKVRYGFKMNNGKVEWIKGGTFYLSEWNAPQNGNTANFKARDLFEFLTDMYFEGIYNASGVSLYTLAERLFEKANLPLNSDGSLKWKIDESLKEIYTTSPLPVDTIANNLQLIANAGCCVLYQDRDGIIRIEPLTNDITDYEITLYNSYNKSNIEMSKPLKEIVISYYDYSEEEPTETEIIIANEINGETIVIDNPLITSRDRAYIVGHWMRNYLKNRMILSSNWRADPRLDALDIVKNINDYTTHNVRMTEIKYSYNGAFKGSGEGRVI